MFTAMVLFCSMYSPTDCLRAVDDKGPYFTKEECEVRIEEMIIDTRLIFPYLAPVGVHCAYDGGEET